MIIIILNYNKFQWLLIKINKAEKNISFYLEEKYSILSRYLEILKENIELEDDIDEYKLLTTKLSINNLNKKINNFNNLINKYMDNNEKLLKKDAIININKELSKVNISINGSKKYYNDNLIQYNHLCHKFPSIIVAKIFKYKDKEFLEENTDDNFKILDEEVTDEEQK
jgi:LemA protein